MSERFRSHPRSDGSPKDGSPVDDRCAWLVPGTAPQPPTEGALLDAITEHEKELLSYPHIAGVGIGATEEGAPFLRLYLRYVPNPESEVIPAVISGLPVGVLVIGNPRVLG